MKKLFESFLTFFFPDTCIVCRKPTLKADYVCKKCERKIDYISPVFKCRTCLFPVPPGHISQCGICLKENPCYSRLISCVKYKGAVKGSLLMYKFHERSDLHIGFSKLACKVLERSDVFFDAVVCVPISDKTLKERGYNQSALIAKEIAEYFDVPFYSDLITKVKETKKQSELKLKERAKNVKGAFGVNSPDRINGLRVLLVDDIFTTGATMREAAKTISPYTDDIVAFTVARGFLEDFE